MANGFLDDLPDLWHHNEYPRRKGRRERIPAKPHFPKPVDCSAVRKKLVDVLINDKVRQKWQAAIMRVSQENRSYDQRWKNDADNPFPIKWLKGGLPYDAIKRRYFNELSEEDYSLWCRIVKELTDLSVIQGSEKTLKVFDEKQQQYWEGHRCLYLWTPNISRLVDDEDLLCYVLAIYHDYFCGIAKKIVTDELRNVAQDVYEYLTIFIGQQKQAELETLFAYAKSGGLLKPAVQRKSKIRERQAADVEAPKILRKLLIPLSPKARLIYEKLSILKVHEAMTTPEILDWLSQEHQKDIDEGTLGKLLKEIKPYGLQNKPRIGYYIPKSS